MTKAKYSRRYSYSYSEDMKKQLFRYNYTSKRLEKICKPSKEMLKDLQEDLKSSLDWLRIEAQENLKSLEETGYIVITSRGLSLENWKESKEYYMDMMCEDMAYLTSDLAKEFGIEL